jgi:hypothetical protein
MFGGDSSTHFALAITDSFRTSLQDISIRTAMNGVKIANTDNIFNYGNSTFSRVEVSLTTAPRIGWDISGIAGVKNYNLMSFDYISAVTGFGTGSTGLRIRNCAYMTFINPDLEGMDTSLDTEGGIAGGAAAFSNVFINGYYSGNVIVRTGSQKTTFVGGRVFGTYTDLGVLTACFNLSNASETVVPMALTTPILTAPTVVGNVNTGPRFTPSGVTLELRNQTGSTVAAGMVVAPAGTSYGFQLALGTSRRFYGVTAASIPAATNGRVVIAGIVGVECTNAAAIGDTLILGTAGNAGKVTSIGTAAPSGAEILLGYAADAIGTAGIVPAIIKH